LNYSIPCPHRVESFIEHQDACTIRQARPELHALQPACSSRTASSTSPSSDTNNFSTAPFPGLPLPKPAEPFCLISEQNNNNILSTSEQQHNLELQLLPSSDEIFATHLKLSIGSSDGGERSEANKTNLSTSRRSVSENNGSERTSEVARLKEFANEELKLAMNEKAYAEEARREAKRQIEIAEVEFANAKRIRQQAQAELEKSQLLKEQATKKISSTMLQITCQACKQQFHASTAVAPSDETSLAVSYMSSATTEGEGE
jgi:hypothetical protein